MVEAGRARRKGGSDDLFDRIGAFLADHRLSFDPDTYRFAHTVLSQPDGPVAREVARLTDGGYRLAREAVERLGGAVFSGQALPRGPKREAPTAERHAEALVAETQAHVDGFAEMMRAMQAETRDFGRDLAASAAAIGHRPDLRLPDEVTRIATAMIQRIRDAEARLEQATAEATALRHKLAKAREDARRDPLTGLGNRLDLAEAYERRAPGDAPHCLALCDVDRFKRINDEFGHGVGDRVLRALAEALAEACKGQLVARYGGEEFAVLLSRCSLKQAAELLDSARAEIAVRRFRDKDTGDALGAITFSAGVTAIRADESAEEALERADRLLYTAKENGRDQVCAG